MTVPSNPQFIDPNSGAAPQPGGAVVGGLASQVGSEDNTKVVEGLENSPPTSNMEAEIQRQALLAAEQAKADGSPPAHVETPALAEANLSSETPSVEKEEQEKQKSEPAPADQPAPEQEKPEEEEKSDAQKETERKAREAAKEEREEEREERKKEREAAKDKREAEREADKKEREASKGRRKE